MGSAPRTSNHRLASKQDHLDVETPVRLNVEDAVAWVTLNRPESLHAMNGGLRGGLHDALTGAAEDRGVRCVVVRGAGRSFCSGGDVGMMAARRQQAAEASSLG